MSIVLSVDEIGSIMLAMRTSESGIPRGRLSRIMVGVAVVVVAGLLAAWAAHRHIPEWYQPAHVPVEDEQAARDELGASFTSLSRGMGKGVRFDFTVRQDELNRWLTARERIWPASKKWIPDQIEGPMVVFGTGEIIIAGTWSGPGPRTVVNIHLRPMVENGELTVVVASVRAGSLPIPLSPIKQQLARMERDHRGDRRPLLPDGTSVVDAIEGSPLPPEIPWTQPRGEFRIEALAIRPGEFRAILEPMPRSRSRN